MRDTKLTPEQAVLAGLAPAFPASPDTTHGLTIRDYFAGQAVADLLRGSYFAPDDLARRAYEFADAMLRERAK